MDKNSEFVLIYLVAFTLSVFLVPVVRRLALKVGAVDMPDRVRKIHIAAVPRMGGVAIFVAFIVPVVAGYFLGASGVLRVSLRVHEAICRAPVEAAGLLSACLLMLLLGVYDDIRHVSPKVKIAVQIAAALILCAVGIRIDQVSNPFGGGPLSFGVFAIPITVFWVLAITNAMNLIDGMDGLGPGVGLFVAVTMFLMAMFYDVQLVQPLTAALVGAIIGFLIFNFHPAKIFMGDSGSLFVGFFLSAVAIQGDMKRLLLIPVVALALPIFDTALAILRRWSRGLPMSTPDKQHLHHRLMRMGFSQREAVFILYGVSVILGCTALVLMMLQDTRQVVIMIAGMAVVGVIVGVHILGGRDFSTIGGRIVTLLRRKRSRRDAWVKLYETTAKLENAVGMSQLWDDVSELLGALDVDAAVLHVARAEHPPEEFSWRHEVADVPQESVEGWTCRFAMSQEGRFSAEFRMEKDTKRSPLPDALPEMIGVLRDGMVKALGRLVGNEGNQDVSSSDAATSDALEGRTTLEGVSFSGDGDRHA